MILFIGVFVCNSNTIGHILFCSQIIGHIPLFTLDYRTYSVMYVSLSNIFRYVGQIIGHISLFTLDYRTFSVIYFRLSNIFRYLRQIISDIYKSGPVFKIIPFMLSVWFWFIENWL